MTLLGLIWLVGATSEITQPVIAAFVVACVTLPLVGLTAWSDYVSLLRTISEPATTPHNFTVGAVLYQAGVQPDTANLVQWAVVVGTLAVALIAVNVFVFLAQVVQSGSLTDPYGELFIRGALYGPAVADGDWYRLLSCAFLHGSILHILFNMLMLWWFGRPLEHLLGRGRFLAIYFISILAGSAGALLVTPDRPTIGASGARVLTTLLYEMGKRDAKKGLATLCIGGGMGIAMCVARD